MSMSTGDRLKAMRKKKGYTQTKVQMLTGIDQSDYSKIERGTRYPTIQQAKSLSMVYETSLDYIYEITDDPSPYPRALRKRKE